MSTKSDAETYVAKPGDRVRLKEFPGVSGVVVTVEQDPERGLIYRTAKGFYLADSVTVEPQEKRSA